jgi:NAD-dependent deacetylase
MTGSAIRDEINPLWLKDVDIIVCVGLSRDDRGFLAWYKKNNPQGKIIAINQEQPSYLGNEDYLLKGNLQKLVPELEKNI